MKIYLLMVKSGANQTVVAASFDRGFLENKKRFSVLQLGTVVAWIEEHEIEGPSVA